MLKDCLCDCAAVKHFGVESTFVFSRRELDGGFLNLVAAVLFTIFIALCLA